MNILTFDVEEWFHILDNDSTRGEKEWSKFEYRLEANLDRIFSLLDEHDQKATFFCLGWVAKEFPQLIRKIHESGYEIASHSHRHQLAYEQSHHEFKHDLELSINSLQDITGSKVRSYRAPGFSLQNSNSWVFDILIEYGIEIDCSVFPAKRAHGGFEQFGHAEPSIVRRNDRQIKEFPINVYNLSGKSLIFSGGGYFRVLPYRIIKRMMHNSSYVMTYFHPRDFDPGQPIIKDLSPTRKFKSYYGLRNAFRKLERLITDFEFLDLQEADSKVDWHKAKIVAV